LISPRTCFHHRADEFSGEDRIFAEIFKGASVARFAGEVNASAERHIETLRAQFAADERSVFVGGVEIPAGCRAQVRGQCGRVAAVLAAAAHAIGGVGHLNGGDAQSRNGGDIPGAAVRLNDERAERAQSGHARAVEHGNLLVDRHLFDHHGGAVVGRKLGIHPGMSLVTGLRGG
jgi:hypothetical protein